MIATGTPQPTFSPTPLPTQQAGTPPFFAGSGTDLAPHDVESEEEVLGGILLVPDVLPGVRQHLPRPGLFFRESHRHIYAAMLAVADRGDVPALGLVVGKLRERGQLDDLDPGGTGRTFLLNLRSQCLDATLAPAYARAVRRLGDERAMLAALGKAADVLYDHSGQDTAIADAQAVIDRAVRDQRGVSAYTAYTAQSSLAIEVPLPAVPAFPVDVVPGPLHTLICQGRDAIGCPAGLVASPALANAAGVIGNRYRLRLKNGWEEVANLWLGVVAPPGSAKTPASNVARRPVERLQREAFDAFTQAQQQYLQSLEVWEAAEKKTRGEKPQPPAPMVHFYTDDATTESLARILGTQPDGSPSPTPGLTSTRDELVGWINGFDAYRGGKGGDRQTWLSLWAGRDAKIDRASKGTTLIREPVVPVTGSIQPDLLPELAGDARRDGFADRFLFTYEEAPPVGWQSQEVTEAAVADVAALYRELRSVQGTQVVDLSTEARTRFAEWMQHENMPRQHQVAGMLQGVYAKLPSQVARLALVLHCLANGKASATVDVSLETVEHALQLGDYYVAHAMKVIARFGPTALAASGLAGRVLRALGDAPEQCLTRDELAAALGRNYPAAAREAAVAELARLGLVQTEAPPPGRPGRPALTIRLHAPVDAEYAEYAETPHQEPCMVCGAAVEAPGGDTCAACEAVAVPEISDDAGTPAPEPERAAEAPDDPAPASASVPGGTRQLRFGRAEEVRMQVLQAEGKTEPQARSIVEAEQAGHALRVVARRYDWPALELDGVLYDGGEDRWRAVIAARVAAVDADWLYLTAERMDEVHGAPLPSEAEVF